MALHAGHCSTCDAEIFRFIAHGRTGERIMLHPMPASVYARLRHPSGGVTPGVGFCVAHMPTVGTDGVVSLDTAGRRYAYWFTEAFGAHLRAWLQDHCELAEHALEAVMVQWDEDRKAVEGVHA
jgi:hypothetical protein